jgi:hypothetical protein
MSASQATYRSPDYIIETINKTGENLFKCVIKTPHGYLIHKIKLLVHPEDANQTLISFGDLKFCYESMNPLSSFENTERTIEMITDLIRVSHIEKRPLTTLASYFQGLVGSCNIITENVEDYIRYIKRNVESDGMKPNEQKWLQYLKLLKVACYDFTKQFSFDKSFDELTHIAIKLRDRLNNWRALIRQEFNTTPPTQDYVNIYQDLKESILSVPTTIDCIYHLTKISRCHNKWKQTITADDLSVYKSNLTKLFSKISETRELIKSLELECSIHLDEKHVNAYLSQVSEFDELLMVSDYVKRVCMKLMRQLDHAGYKDFVNLMDDIDACLDVMVTQHDVLESKMLNLSQTVADNETKDLEKHQTLRQMIQELRLFLYSYTNSKDLSRAEMGKRVELRKSLLAIDAKLLPQLQNETLDVKAIAHAINTTMKSFNEFSDGLAAASQHEPALTAALLIKEKYHTTGKAVLETQLQTVKALAMQHNINLDQKTSDALDYSKTNYPGR